MTIDTTNLCSHLQKKLFEPEGVYYPIWQAMQNDKELTTAVRSRQLHIYRNGKKILIHGNHDKPVKTSSAAREKFEQCVDYLEIYVQDPGVISGKQHIVLCHYAMLVWNKRHHMSWMLHGHSHGSLTYPFNGRILDVGVDSHSYAPVSDAGVHFRQ